MRLSRVLLISLTLIIGLSIVESVSAQDPPPLILAEYGPYDVGTTSMTFVDSSRQDHEVRVNFWYPAIIRDKEQDNLGATRNADPEPRDAPYPLVLASHGLGMSYSVWGSRRAGDWAGHLASYGFIVAAPDHDDRGSIWLRLADRPLDILFVLNQLAELPEGDLFGMINTDQVGVWGPSLGGYTAMVTNGSRIDLPHLMNWCTDQPDINQRLHPCYVTLSWDTFAQSIAQVNLRTDAPWPPLSDERIRAVVAVLPWGGPLFGEDGLGAAEASTLIIGATQDTVAVYARDAVFMYTHLGSEERYLISLIDAEHGSQWTPRFTPYVLHFTTAYFEYHLYGQEDYAQYLTADYVEQFDDLAWGPVEIEDN